MIEFAVTVQGQRISCTKVKGELVSGTIGAKVRFTWSEEWQQLQRIGVFRAGSIARDVMDLQDECVIPWEVLAQPGQVLMIGVQGVNEEGTAVTPTLEAEMGEILRGADPSDDPSTEPTLPIWQWVKNLLKQVARLMEHSVLFTKQDLTPSEQAQARDNIGAADSAFVGDSAAALDAIIEMQEALLNASGTKPDDYGTPYAVEYIKQKLTEIAKAQARDNIGAMATSGGTMSGAINMGGNRIWNMANPTQNGDAVNLAMLNSIGLPSRGVVTETTQNEATEQGIYIVDGWGDYCLMFVFVSSWGKVQVLLPFHMSDFAVRMYWGPGWREWKTYHSSN